MKYSLPVLAVLSLAFGQQATAEGDLETTLVTATRTQQTIENSLAPVSVFTSEEIDTLQAKSMTELLSRVPGVEFSNSGVRGSASSLYIRGTADDHTLFLIDGQRFSSATLGSTNFQLIDPEQIDRIEVVRGPRSSIYGSDAIGGVVQIFTRRGDGEPTHNVRIGAGSHNSWQVSANSYGEIKAFHYAVSLSQFETDGFDSFYDETPPNDDDDGHRSTTASVNLGFAFGDTGVLDLTHFYTRSKTEYDDRFVPPTTKPYTENWIQTTNLHLVVPQMGIWSPKFTLARTIDDSDNHDDLDPVNRSNFRTRRDAFSWQNDFAWTRDQLFTVGYDYYNDTVDSTTVYTTAEGNPVDERSNEAVYGVFQITWSDFDVQLGLREDDNEDFGDKTTTNAAVGYTLGTAHKVILSYGEGYKVPTFNDLYWPITPWSYGNPDLRSETSENYELELRGSYTALRWNLNLYRNNIRDMIDWAPVDPLNPFGAWTPSNVNDARIDGIELAVITTLSEWQVTAAAHYMETEDEATGQRLVNRPRKSLTVDADRDIGNWQLGFTLQAVGNRYGDQQNVTEVGGYAIVNARLGYRFNSNLRLQCKVNNVFDRDYRTRADYNEDSVNTFVTLTYTL